MEQTSGKVGLNEHIVVVIDLCSSSVILENLEQGKNLIVWKQFWSRIAQLIKEDEAFEKADLYKFTGDGFILILSSGEWANAIKICNSIVRNVNMLINELMRTHLDTAVPRLGVTIGMDYGELLEFEIDGRREYTGIAINIAARLQALLKGKKDVNKAMISYRVRKNLSPLGKVRRLRPVMSVLRNIFRNASVLCYEVDFSIMD